MYPWGVGRQGTPGPGTPPYPVLGTRALTTVFSVPAVLHGAADRAWETPPVKDSLPTAWVGLPGRTTLHSLVSLLREDRVITTRARR